VIEVTDNGSGITPENQRRLFQEFTRFSPGAAHGAGIGLAISQRIAHALGGAITVESELGVGSTFSLRLPSGEIQREENPILFSNHAENHAEITSGKRHP
jgi:signal transduction histidine kinase